MSGDTSDGFGVVNGPPNVVLLGRVDANTDEVSMLASCAGAVAYELCLGFYCALCPCRLTCQQFGMVRDVGNLVGMDKLHFPCILLFALLVL